MVSCASEAAAVELALEAYEVREAGREPASVFYARLAEECGTEVDLDALIRESRQTHLGEAAALAYGDIMGAAFQQGRPMSAPDGMIAAIARINNARLATRNMTDFGTTGLELICPWNF